MAAAGRLEISYTTDQERRLLELVARAADVLSLVSLAHSDRLSATLPGGLLLTQRNAICRSLISLGTDPRSVLLGGSPEHQAQVAEFLSSTHTTLRQVTEDKLLELNDHLLLRTCLVGSQPTLADIVLFDHLHRAVVAFPVAQVDRYANLVRWFDYVQHTVDTASVFPRADFPKPKFRLPAPLPSPVAKAVGCCFSKCQPALPLATEAVMRPQTQADKGQAQKPPADSRSASMASTIDVAAEAAPAPSTPLQLANGQPTNLTAAPTVPEASATAPIAEASDDTGGRRKRKDKEKKEKPPKAPAADEAEVAVDLLDLRVGQIVKVAKHPNADSLYVEDIDIGEAQPRQVVSGLVNFVPLEQMQGRRVVVVANMKPVKMRDVLSSGMVLCASNETHDKVVPLAPPATTPVGEKITFSGYDRAPEPVLNPRKKYFENIAEDLRTDSVGVATYKSVPFMTTEGPICANLPMGRIS